MPDRDGAAAGWAIALHGGAGTILRARMTAEAAAAHRAGLGAALAAGRAILAEGGTSLDAVEATVRVLEDDPLFNAGRGAVLTAAGGFECDAAVMDGRDLSAGAVIGVGTVANPVSLARLVMEETAHVALAGAGAEAFAAARGIPVVGPAYFDTPRRRAQLAAAREAQTVALDHSDHKFGTVGAVARDRAGNLAAATSTGGMTNKMPGRVGDSPMIGAGTYASNAGCAVSATGHGELFIRHSVARDIAALVEYAGLPLAEAVARKLCRDLPEGSGGVIALGARGAPELVFNTPGMYRAWHCEGGAPRIGFHAGEEAPGDA